MPWLIRPQGKGFVLLNQETGAQKGPVFKSQQEARSYQDALYANDPAARTEAKKIEAAGHGGQMLAGKKMPMMPMDQKTAKADAIKRRNDKTHGGHGKAS